MIKEKRQEFAARITQANRSELVVITYEIILTYIEEAYKLHAEGNLEQFADSTKSAQKFLLELMESLDFKYDISKELLPLYIYVNKQLITAIMKDSVEPLDSAKVVLTKLMGGFEKVRDEDNSKPVMSNTESIYAGITYGKGTLNEMSVSNMEGNRGFIA